MKGTIVLVAQQWHSAKLDNTITLQTNQCANSALPDLSARKQELFNQQRVNSVNMLLVALQNVMYAQKVISALLHHKKKVVLEASIIN